LNTKQPLVVLKSSAEEDIQLISGLECEIRASEGWDFPNAHYYAERGLEWIKVLSKISSENKEASE